MKGKWNILPNVAPDILLSTMTSIGGDVNLIPINGIVIYAYGYFGWEQNCKPLRVINKINIETEIVVVKQSPGWVLMKIYPYVQFEGYQKDCEKELIKGCDPTMVIMDEAAQFWSNAGNGQPYPLSGSTKFAQGGPVGPKFGYNKQQVPPIDPVERLRAISEALKKQELSISEATEKQRWKEILG